MKRRVVRRPRIYLGIDPASQHLAFVAMANPEDFWVEFHVLGKTSGPGACSAALDVTNAVVERINAQWPDHLIVALIEQPVVGRGGVWATLSQTFTSGAVQGALHHAGCRVTPVHHSHWKKVVTGRGNATKDDIARCLERRWPAVHEAADGSQDVLDAAALALLGWGSRPRPAVAR
jgi:Holliday junction resolvasome RuvABC endonuclease subunit